MRSRQITAFSLCFSLWITIGSSDAATPVEVGLIESFDGPSDHYVLRRGEGAEQMVVPVQPGGRLVRGDRIEVKFEGEHMTIWLFEPGAAKKSVIVLSRNGGYVVDGNAPENGVSQRLSGIWQWAAQELGLRDVQQRERAAAEASIRDISRFVVPLLKDPQTLAAGRRAISIAWPGQDRARIEITGPDSRIISIEASASGKWRSELIDLEPGSYKIAITPESDGRIERTIQVVPESSFPAFPADSSAAQLPAEFVDTLRATWLAGRGRRFALESFQMVAPIADRYYPAKLLSEALIEGSLPSKPR
jgi:hypothetical protein